MLVHTSGVILVAMIAGFAGGPSSLPSHQKAHVEALLLVVVVVGTRADELLKNSASSQALLLSAEKCKKLLSRTSVNDPVLYNLGGDQTRKVLEYEIGHALGLADNADPNSVMNVAETISNRVFDANDTAGIQYLYAPVVTSSTASLGANATTLTISGSGFSTVASSNVVTFSNGVKGTVTAATATQLTVEVFRQDVNSGKPSRVGWVGAESAIGEGGSRQSLVVAEVSNTQTAQGDTLKDLIARGCLPPVKSARIAVAVADALAYMHARGLSHRDVKPANILATQERENLEARRHRHLPVHGWPELCYPAGQRC